VIPASWNNAQDTCQASGGALAVLETETALNSMKTDVQVWIGLRQLPLAVYPDQDWYWTLPDTDLRLPLANTNGWASGEPNDNNGGRGMERRQ
jgi:hypothetical protein